MVIKKNFKIIGEDGLKQSINLNKDQQLNSQVKITLSEEEKQKVQQHLSSFFSSVKVLLEEGAVIIGEDEEKTLEEEFVQNPYMKSHNTSLYSLALSSLPKKKAEQFQKQIQGIKMNKSYEFEFQTQHQSEIKTFLEQIISTELKKYVKDLPMIMEKRQKKLELLFESRPDIKKYLENTKK